ncbi:MAG: 30S ribosomal protein S14 [Candidatus Diapherotrites archaeon]|nr:30S ribosomal protein S14 [Candidatus Diapherotrites archaeon]
MTDKTNEKKGKGDRKCRICGNPNSVIRKYGLYVCRRCFRDKADEIGFKKYS